MIEKFLKMQKKKKRKKEEENGLKNKKGRKFGKKIKKTDLKKEENWNFFL